MWFAAATFAVILVFLLIFIMQNSAKVQISYLGLHGELRVGVALLFAAILGALLVAIPGSARIVQLRMLARRQRAAAARLAGPPAHPNRTTAPAPGKPAGQ